MLGLAWKIRNITIMAWGALASLVTDRHRSTR